MGDVYEEDEGCIVCVIVVVEDMLGDGLIDSWGELDDVVDVDGEAEYIGVDVLDNIALGVPDID